MLYDQKWDLDAVGRVLFQAAEEIETGGWVRSALYVEGVGMCMVGAILSAQKCLLSISSCGVTRHAEAASHRLAAYLDHEGLNKVGNMTSLDIIAHANDHVVDSKEHAIRLLKGAASFQQKVELTPGLLF